ncbi:MAG TPA: phytanoyl-CoA dioxygenase family protein [Puia sp.]|nr:phytanoyl-CoA dioxygenase family protein [Puia sp.]
MTQAKTDISLDDFIAISTAQRDEFRVNGHLLVRGLLSSSEAEVYRQQILDAVKRQSREKRKAPERGIYGRSFGQWVNLWRTDEGVRRLVLSKRLGKVAADLLGVENVRIYHDHALLKEAGGRATYWHQDQYYWPLDTADTITVAIALTDQSVEMGMFVYATGSHRNGTIVDPRLSSEPDTAYRKYIREHQFPLSRAAGMRAGDASWHFGNTVHHTSANTSDRRREMMTITYMADGARVARPVHPAQEYELHMWLGSLPPGRQAASEFNPTVL